MTIELLEDLTVEQDRELAKQGVSMDDYDYIIVLDADLLESNSTVAHSAVWVDDERLGFRETEETEAHPTRRRVNDDKDYDLPWTLLRGCFANHWHIAQLNGSRVGIGIAYHG